MGCDILKINNINPYTETGTFGISWNGGYKPDQTLEYIRPDDDSVPVTDYNSVGELPLFAIPPNIYLKTAESRRANILEGGIPPRVYEFDKADCAVVEDPLSTVTMEEVDDKTTWDKFLIGIILALLVIVFLSMKKD